MFLLLQVHAAATLFMTGVIWFVQIVHYPLFAGVGPAAFAGYERSHSARTTWVVAPVMLIELVSALALTTAAASGVTPWMSWLGAGLLAVIWLSTFLLQVPRHGELARGFDAASHQRLVSSNWIRTVAWSIRAALSLAMMSQQ